MISVFLSKLLTSRQASFTDDSISIFGIPFVMESAESLADLQFLLEKKFGEKGVDVMTSLGRSMSESIISNFKAKFKITGMGFEAVWPNMFRLSGLGNIEIVEAKPKSAIFQMTSSAIANAYSEKYKKSRKSVCSVISGMLESYIEETRGKKAKCREVSCTAMGNKSCRFELQF